jgi:WD40 repeat protein
MVITDTHLWTGSWDKTIKQWDLVSGECIATLEGHTDFIKSLVLNGTMLYSGSSDCFLRQWNTSTLTCITAEKKHKRAIECLAVSEDGKHIYSGSSDGTILKWDCEKMQVLQSFKGHETSIYCVRVWEDDLWTASADKTVRRWNCATGVADMVLTHPDRVKSIVLAGPYVVTGSSDDDIRVWDIGSGKLVCTIEGHFDEVSSLTIIGNTVYSGSLDCSLRRWPLTTAAIKQYNETREARLKRLEEENQKKDGMTEEEERELAELMLSDDE